MKAGPEHVNAMRDAHLKKMEAQTREATRLRGVSNRVAFLNLALVLAGLAVGGGGIFDGNTLFITLGGACLLGFLVLWLFQARLHSKRDQAEVRAGVHRRHLARQDGSWSELPLPTSAEAFPEHPYAFDIDLSGPGSLLHRLDVSHTLRGERTFLNWLAAPASLEVVHERQEAVQELAGRADFRHELESAAALAKGDAKLDDLPFVAFTKKPPYLLKRPWLIGLIYLLPIILVGMFFAGSWGLVPSGYWAIVLVLQIALWFATAGAAAQTFELIAARRGFVEAFYRTLLVAERGSFESPALKRLTDRLSIDGSPPSALMRRLDRWTGLSDLRTQFPLNLVVNWFMLWDLHVLHGLERWNRDVGGSFEGVFEVLGELEALCAFANLVDCDPAAVMPEVSESGEFAAEELSHPLIPVAERVANSVSLSGPGSALIVTGSNMAGKSTLLRAVGLNIALALAGAPVTAKSMKVPLLRLRASMRARDDLQRGASYFHAELTKLRTVVDRAEDSPPIFFLLDELLRGTNAHARHIGARGVLSHLIARGGMGLVATHDIALSTLEKVYPKTVHNAHFTDVIVDGEMTFDYRLREGVVRTSNALRLLKMAGIDVPDDDSLGDALSDS